VTYDDLALIATDFDERVHPAGRRFFTGWKLCAGKVT